MTTDFESKAFPLPLDAAVADFVARRWPDVPPELRRVLALANHRARQGHGALDLESAAGTTDGEAAGGRALAGLLARCPAVGDGSDGRPFVLEDGLLYLRRFHRDEVRLAQRLRELAAGVPALPAAAGVEAVLAELFPGVPDFAADPHALACLVSLVSRLTVVLGGPGTGKTTVVARMLALHRRLSDGTPRIAVAAPTGKAAARVGEAMAAALARFEGDARTTGLLSMRAVTLHRLLGADAEGVRFRYGAQQPLPFDIVVVDEASMIDQTLFRRLLEAMPDPSRLIVLGDPDQLEAIESGAVLAELAGLPGDPPNRSPQLRVRSFLGGDAAGPAAAGIEGCIVRLERNWRFAPASGIGRLTGAIRCGDGGDALSILAAGAEDLVFVDGRAASAPAQAAIFVRERYRQALANGDPAAMLRAHAAFRVLAASQAEVSRANQAACQALGQRWRPGLAEPGLPFLVVRNDPLRQLHNGDTGIFWTRADTGLRAFMPSGDRLAAGADALRTHAVAEIGEWLPAHAMTVHRAQGGEYDEVLVLLPPVRSPLLSRSWLYTAVSRARSRLILHGDPDAVPHAVATSLTRTSGLAARLQR